MSTMPEVEESVTQEQAVTEQVVAEQAVTEQAAADQAVTEQAVTEQGAPEQSGAAPGRSAVPSRPRAMLVGLGIALVAVVAVGSIVLLGRAAGRIAALEQKATALGVLEARSERARQIRRWIIAQNPKALMVDFDGFAAILLDQAARYDLDYRVVMAVIQKESGWQPDTVGRDGEIGLMQVRPETAAGVAKRLGIEFVPPKQDGRGGYSELGSLRDPRVNIQLGIGYLREQIDEFGMQPEALQAYNRGPGRARLSWLWDSYAADVARNFGALVLWEGFPAGVGREASAERSSP